MGACGVERRDEHQPRVEAFHPHLATGEEDQGLVGIAHGYFLLGFLLLFLRATAVAVQAQEAL